MLTRLSEHVMWRRVAGMAVLALTLAMMAAPAALAAQPPTEAPGAHAPGGEINIQLPDLNQGAFLGMTGHQILLTGLVVCVLGLLFGAWTYVEVKKLPVHESMAEVSALIYETCKAYLVQQGKFLLCWVTAR
jgi:K(+)-stimulated pyrophosphate-energized sodium pump